MDFQRYNIEEKQKEKGRKKKKRIIKKQTNKQKNPKLFILKNVST